MHTNHPSGDQPHTHPQTRQPAARILPKQLLRVRPITPATGEAGA